MGVTAVAAGGVGLPGFGALDGVVLGSPDGSDVPGDDEPVVVLSAVSAWLGELS
ncbi:hypothetical protein MASR2M48_11010 [Spirochaetota bacterium]